MPFWIKSTRRMLWEYGQSRMQWCWDKLIDNKEVTSNVRIRILWECHILLSLCETARWEGLRLGETSL
jgi:hypothetical protein